MLLTVGSVLAQLLTGAAGALLARDGGPREFGDTTIFLALVALISDLCDFGSGTFVARELAAGRISLERSVAEMRKRLPVYCLAAVAAPVLVGVTTDDGLAEVAAAAYYLVAFGCFTSLMALLRAEGRYGKVAQAAIIERAVLLGLAGLAYSSDKLDGTTFLLALSTGSALGTAVCLISLRCRPWNLGESSPISQLYGRAWHLGISGLATDLNVLETPIIAIGAGQAAAGYYGAASRLSAPLSYPGSGIAAVIIRRLSSHRTAERDAWPAFKDHTITILLLLFTIAAVAASGGLLMPLIFGNQFSGVAVPVFRILCAVTAVGLLTVVVYAGLIALRGERQAAVCQWVCVPAGLVLTFSGAVTGGVTYAALGSLLAQTIQLVWLIIILRKIVVLNGREEPHD